MDKLEIFKPKEALKKLKEIDLVKIFVNILKAAVIIYAAIAILLLILGVF